MCARRTRSKRVGNARDHRAHDHDHTAGDQRLDRAGDVQPHDELELRHGCDEVTFVQPAGLVVDVHDPAAHHRGEENREHDRARQQVLDVRYVRIDFDDRQAHVGGRARRHAVAVVRAEQRRHAARERGRAELIRVVLYQCDRRTLACKQVTREVRRDRDDAVDAAFAQIDQRAALVGVGHRFVRARIGRDSLQHRVELHGRHVPVVIDDADLEVLDLAAERVAEDHELHQRHRERHDDERRVGFEPPQIALDDGQ